MPHLCVLMSGSGLAVKETRLQQVRGFLGGKGEERARAGRGGCVSGTGVTERPSPGLFLCKMCETQCGKESM